MGDTLKGPPTPNSGGDRSLKNNFDRPSDKVVVVLSQSPPELGDLGGLGDYESSHLFNPRS